MQYLTIKKFHVFHLHVSHVREAERVAARAFVLRSTYHPLPTDSQRERADQMEAQLFQASRGPLPAMPPPLAQLLPRTVNSRRTPAQLVLRPPGLCQARGGLCQPCSPLSVPLRGPWTASPSPRPSPPPPGTSLDYVADLVPSISPHGASCFMDALRASPAPEATLQSPACALAVISFCIS